MRKPTSSSPATRPTSLTCGPRRNRSNMALPPLLERIGLEWPIFQAPMAGTSTPAMAAAVSNAGALGAIGVAAESAQGAEGMIRATQGLTNRAFNVNVFCHRPAIANAEVEAALIARLKPEFTALGAEP